MFFCAEVVNDVCTSWVKFSDILSVEDALMVGGLFLSLTVSAWGLGFIASQILTNNPSRY